MEETHNTTKGSFQFEKLKEARESRGYTIRELAEAIGLNNHQTLSKYENGKSILPTEVLFNLMGTLNFPYSYFFEDDKINYGNEVVFFRSKAATTAKLKKIHEIKLNWVIKIFRYLETILDFPDSNLPNIDRKSTHIFQPTNFEEIEKLASSIRRRWGLTDGPIDNLTDLFERNGIVISVVHNDEYYVDACSKWIDNKLFILVGNEKATPSKIKFTLAHELGHYLLHHHLPKDEFNKKEVYKRIEEEANRFASAFLLPAEVFANELISHSLDYFQLLKKRWQVSIQAMIYRAKELNLINENQTSYLWKLVAKNGWRKKEPYDDILENESTVLLKEAIEMIVNHNVMTKQEILKAVKLSANDLIALTNLELGYFNDDFSEKIVKFKRE